MKANLLAAACVLGAAASASAQYQQYPYPNYPPLNPANVMPNVYNPQYQPLSPYLNLLRGGNAGVNYYYGVRPGTVGGAGPFGGASMLAPGGMRAPFMPQLASAPDPVELPDRTRGHEPPNRPRTDRQGLPPRRRPRVFRRRPRRLRGDRRGRGPAPGTPGRHPPPGPPARPRRNSAGRPRRGSRLPAHPGDDP